MLYNQKEPLQMELEMYSIRDSKGAGYGAPFYTHTKQEAERHLHRLKKDPNSMVKAFPEDYDLYHVGYYDTEKGVVKPLDTPQHILKAAAIVDQ